MKAQWIMVFGLFIAFLTAVIAVFNIKYVALNFILGEVQVSLIIIISASVLIGGFVVALFGLLRPRNLKGENVKLDAIKQNLHKENDDLKRQLNEAQRPIITRVEEVK